MDSLPARLLFCREYVRAGFCSFDFKYSLKTQLCFKSLKIVNSIYFTTFVFFTKYKNLDSVLITRISQTIIFQSNVKLQGFVPSLFLHSPCPTHTSHPQLHRHLNLSFEPRRAALACSRPSQPLDQPSHGAWLLPLCSPELAVAPQPYLTGHHQPLRQRRQPLLSAGCLLCCRFALSTRRLSGVPLGKDMSGSV